MKNAEGWAGLARSRSGVTALEFAFVGPLTIMILIVGVDLGYAMFLKSMFSDALVEAARWSATANTSLANNGKWADMMAVIAQKTALVPSVRAAAYDASQIATGAATLPSPLSSVCRSGNSNDAALGGPGDIVVYCLSYTDPIIGPAMKGFLSLEQSSNLNIISTTVARNEPL